MKLSKKLQRFCLFSLSCIFALLLVEIGLRLLWKPQLTTWPRSFSTSIPINPQIIPGVVGPARISTNSSGLRGDEWSTVRGSEYRILTIGGSTTECLLNDQANTWPALLQTKLGTLDGRKVWVGNAGHAGFNSRHHVLEMKFMLDQYDPDAVVVMVGGNDGGVLLNEGMSYDANFIDKPEKMRELALLDFVEKPISVLKHPDTAHLKLVRDSYLYLMARGILGRFIQPPHGATHDVEMYRRFRQQRQNPWLVVREMPSDLSLGLKGYERNIREMIRLAKQRKVRLIFLTQPSLFQPNMSQDLINSLWSGWVGNPRANIYWSPDIALAVTNAHNSLLLDISHQEGIECIDLASNLPKTLEVFFDQCHFTDYGCRLVSDELASYLRSVPGTVR